MLTKTFEIRDKGTLIPVIAVRLDPGNEADRFLLSRAGYSSEPAVQRTFILLCEIHGGQGKCTSDVHEWRDRTLTVAHHYITDNWDGLESGSVVDVQFILNETSSPKLSESLTDKVS